MIRFNDVSFRYGGREKSSGVNDLNLMINQGEVVVLCGESGCGKTTITRLINGLIPNYYEGALTGTVLVNDQVVSEMPLYESAKIVGSVFQNPRSQFFNVDTTSELAFGCENIGLPEAEIKQRITSTVAQFNMETLINRSIFELSGGEKQKVACASVSAMMPEVMVLDEPSSNLDISAIEDLQEMIGNWKRQGKTIIVSEHRLYYLRDLADRFIYLKNGSIENEYLAAEFKQLTAVTRKEMGLRLLNLNDLEWKKKVIRESAAMIRIQNLHFNYKHQQETLRLTDHHLVMKGITAIIGANGAGKSTFARCFCGLEKKCGLITTGGKNYRAKERLNKCYMVMQEVNHQLFAESVMDELLISMVNPDLKKASDILETFDLSPYRDVHPMALSGGQQQRVAIAAAIAADRDILFLDEPTSGLDLNHMQEVATVLRQLYHLGKSIFVITHDPEFIMACCTDVLLIEDGQLTQQFQLDDEGIGRLSEFFEETGGIEYG